MADVAPRYCSEHLDVELVRLYDAWAPVNVQAALRQCPRPSHGLRRNHRCAWCGGPILTRQHARAVYCGTRCRVAAHRARQPVTPPARVASVTASPGPNAAARSAAGETVQEVQE